LTAGENPDVTEATPRTVTEERSRIAAAVYGTILVLAVLSYLSEVDELGRGDVAAAVLGTAIAYFSAHVYVDYLSWRMIGERAGTAALTRRVIVEEWPLLHAMLAPGVPLVLGAVGVLSRSTAIDVALIVALVDLVGWGYQAGRRSYKNWVGAVGSALVALALGLIVVALKNLLH
jgi:hypothetical protein